MQNLPSGTPLDPSAHPSLGQGESRMNIDISPRKPGEMVLYTGPHLCVTCAQANRITSQYLKAGETAPECPQCGSLSRWEP